MEEQEILLEPEAVEVRTGGGAVDSVNGMTGDVVLTTSDLENTSDYQTGTEVESAISTAVSGKQDALTAGSNITISEQNVISATDTTYSAGDGLNLAGTEFSVNTNTIATKQSVTAIEEKIPNQASAQNQLADKDFVNSSIATNTAYYISDNGQPFTSVAALEAYSGTLTNNDYAFVVGTDAQGNTVYDRYKYNADTGEWAFEYELNNSSFTAAQWAAINSGITSGDVTKLTGLADIQTIGANLTLTNGELSATDTTYSDFTGTDGTAAGSAGLVPAPATTDAGKYLKADGTWDTVQAGPTVVQTTGTSTTDVMSQDAVTSMVFFDPSQRTEVRIGTAAGVYGDHGVALGSGADCSSNGGVALGAFARTGSTQGVISIRVLSGFASSAGYNNSQYRLLTGLYDGQSDHDAVTLGQLNGRVLQNTGAPTTATVGTVGQLLEDTTNGKLYICTAADTVTPSYTWEEVGGGGGSSITELTSADYNWPTNNPVGVALWLLDNGDYYVGDASVAVYITTTHIGTQGIYTVADYSSASKQVLAFSLLDRIAGLYRMNNTTGVAGMSQTFIPPTIVQTTGTSTTDVMSQNAVTSMVYADPSTRNKVQIGSNAYATGVNTVSIGAGSAAGYNRSSALGAYSIAGASGATAVGYGSIANTQGEVGFGLSSAYTGTGYNNSDYRLLTGLYDPQSAHDAATKGYVDPTTDSTAPTTATVGRLGQIYVDSSTATAYMCVAVDDVTPSYTWKAITA